MSPMNDPTHDAHDPKIKDQKAIIFVREYRGEYSGMLLGGTPAVENELVEGGGPELEMFHEAMWKNVPRRRGLHIWEGTIDYTNPNEAPEWPGAFRNMTPQDFTDLDV